jgi:hypothetical protein
MSLRYSVVLALTVGLVGIGARLVAGLAFSWPLLLWLGMALVVLLALSRMTRQTISLRVRWPEVLTGLVLIFWTIGVVWGQGYLSPIYERQFVAGRTHIDTLYLSSYANMLTNYRTMSTGVDGFAHVPYHFLSNLVMGVLGKIGGVGAFAAYHLAFPIVIVPIFFFVLLRSLEILKPATPSVAFAILTLGTVGIMPQEWRLDIIIGWNSVLGSESYTVGLIMLLSLCFVLWRHSSSSKTVPTGKILLAAMLVFLCGLSKISLAALIACAAAYWWLRWHRSQVKLLAWPLLFGVATLASFLIANDPAVAGGIRPLDFIRNYVPMKALPWFFVQYWPLALLWGTRKQGTREETVATELLTVIAVAGIIPGLVLSIAGGSAFYFINVYYWPALVLATSRTSTVVAMRADSIRRARFNPIVIFVGAIIIGTALVNTLVADHLFTIRLRASLAQENSDMKELQAALQSIPDDNPGESVVWISSDLTTYWNNDYSPEARGFFVPALTGLATLWGVPPEVDLASLPRFRGYGSYLPRDWSERPQTTQQILEEASEAGYTRVHLISRGDGISVSTLYTDDGP